jgi:hypothetical protein
LGADEKWSDNLKKISFSFKKNIQFSLTIPENHVTLPFGCLAPLLSPVIPQKKERKKWQTK